jgi:hypothetical protein
MVICPFKRKRQSEHVGEHPARHREIELILDVDQQQGARDLGHEPEQGDDRECGREQQQNAGVAARNDVVDRDLQVPRRHQQQRLHEQREQENLDALPGHPAGAAEQARQRQPPLHADRREVLRRREFHGNAGEMVRDLLGRQPQHAAGGIVDHERPSSHRFEDHEMVHVPVQDRRHLEVREILRLEPEGTGLEPDLFGQMRHRVNAQSIRGRGMAEPKGNEIDAVPEPGGDHSQAGMPALGRFGLTHQWQMAKAGKHLSTRWVDTCHGWATPNTHSPIQPRMVRWSVSIVAVSSMSGRSAACRSPSSITV